MYKCVFICKKGRPKPDGLAGFNFLFDFNDLRSRQIKMHFSLVFVFSGFISDLCSKDDNAAAIALNSAAALV
jgi:hypothetical protein